MFGLNLGLTKNRVLSRLINSRAYAAPRSFGSLPEKGQESLFIIDALYLVFRVHYGFRDNRLVAGGQDTTILHGFFYNILSMLKSVDPLPTHVAVVLEGNTLTPSFSDTDSTDSDDDDSLQDVDFYDLANYEECDEDDGPVPSFILRKRLDPEYKANRPPTPIEVKEGLSVIPDVCQSLGLRCVSAPGYEGDDVAATLATMASRNNMKTYIVSKDKDFKQLLGPDLIILKAGSKSMRKEYSQYTLKDFEEDSGGLMPKQWVDVMALAGDQSDNISGVEGVGEKSALKLIHKFQSIENLFQNLDQVPGNLRRKNLQAEGSKEKAEICKQMIKLRTDISSEEMDIKGIDDFRFLPPPDGGTVANQYFKLYELKVVKTGFQQLWGLYQ